MKSVVERPHFACSTRGSPKVTTLLQTLLRSVQGIPGISRFEGTAQRGFFWRVRERVQQKTRVSPKTTTALVLPAANSHGAPVMLNLIKFATPFIRIFLVFPGYTYTLRIIGCHLSAFAGVFQL